MNIKAWTPEYYGDKLLANLSIDLQKKFGRGFSVPLTLMKLFYQEYPLEKICQTLSNESSGEVNIFQTLSAQSIDHLLILQGAKEYVSP